MYNNLERVNSTHLLPKTTLEKSAMNSSGILTDKNKVSTVHENMEGVIKRRAVPQFSEILSEGLNVDTNLALSVIYTTFTMFTC